MSYEGELQLFQRMLNQLNLGYSITEIKWVPLEMMDMSLRSILGVDTQNRESWENRAKNDFREKVIYYVTDDFECRYVSLILPESEPRSALVVGPYLAEEIDRVWIEGFIREHAIDEKWVPILENHYRRLPVMTEERMLFAAFQALGERLWGPDQFTTERYVKGVSETWALLAKEPEEKLRGDILSDYRLIEQRYEAENLLMQVVARGRVQKAQLMLSGFKQSAMEHRTDPARDIKNYSIILNTLMRKAAERGGVHPVYIDQVSREFARQIERTSGWESFMVLWRDMAQKYCLLVKKHSVSAYSHLVQQVMAKIDLDLTADLSLKSLAAQLNVNASYLSALFRRETNHTVTEYVTERRVEQAMYLLTTTRLPISTIGQQCGIQDDNYFTKVFKRYAGKTPREFRHDQHRLPKV